MAKVLVIDDDKDILRLLDFTLKRVGHEVILCSDGVQGLAEVEAQKPDIIVADVMMPKMTGYEFCKQARANPAGQDIPIIIFSARFQPIDKQTALDAGATDYLPKSISPEVLIKSISEYLPADSAPTTSAMIGFFSLQGGVGITTLAVNTAIALGSLQQTQAALVDLAPFGGHGALMLGLRPTKSVSTALATSENSPSLDSIKTHFMAHSSGVRLLASTLSYDHKLPMEDIRLEQLVTALKSGVPICVFDLPHLLEPQSGSTLKLLDKIALVLSPEVPSLQSTAMALQGLARLGIPENRVLLVLNRVRSQGGLPVETIQKAVKRPIAAEIPYEPEMIRAVNSGNPLLLSSPKSAGAAAIAQLARKLLG